MSNSLRIRALGNSYHRPLLSYFQRLEPEVITTQHQTLKPFLFTSFVAFLNLTPIVNGSKRSFQAKHYIQFWLPDLQVYNVYSLVLKGRRNQGGGGGEYGGVEMT